MDPAHKATDKEIESLERKLKKEYKAALSEIQSKASSYFAKFEKEDDLKKEQLKHGIITDKEYFAWRQAKMTKGEQYNTLIKDMAADLANTDKIAMGIIGDRVPEVYAINSNYAAYEMSMAAGANISFDLYDRHTAERLIDNPIFYPNLDIAKDERWNEQKVRSAILQGVLQGDSLPKIANRLQQVTDMDDRAAARNARTYMTRAQNAGRLDRYHEAEEKGLQYNKEWISTDDNRTRDTHKDKSEGGVGGEVVGIDEEFPNKLQYPGDPAGDPSEVYNCRCTMRSIFVGVKKEAQEEFGKLDPDTTFEEWTEQKKEERPQYVGNTGMTFEEVYGDKPTVEKQITGIEDYEERSEWLQNTLDIDEDDADYYLEALDQYTKGDYTIVHNNTAEGEDIIFALDEMLREPDMPIFDGITYRGIHIKDSDGITGEEKIKAIISSGTWNEPGITSFSSRRDIAEKFTAKNTEEGFNVLIINNKNITGCPVEHLTDQRPEGEVLVPSDIKDRGYKITKYEIKGKQAIIEVEENEF